MTTAREVRCYTCGVRQAAEGPECTACGTPFRGLCNCGAVVSLYDERCAACHEEVFGPRLPWRLHPAVRIVKWTLAAGLVVAAGYAAFRPRIVEPWRVRNEALELMGRTAYRDAARRFEELLTLRPGDRDALMNLAICRSRLGRAPTSCLEPALEVLEAEPDFIPALVFAALEERRHGESARAIDYAERAIAAAEATADLHRLRALLELESPLPDLEVAARHLQGALRGGGRDPELELRLAETLLQIHRRPGGGAPPGLSADLERAYGVLEGRSADADTHMARSRLLLALDRPAEALREADAAIDFMKELDDEVPTERIARAKALRGRAWLLQAPTAPNRERVVANAMLDFADALRSTRDVPVTLEVSEVLVAVGEGRRAEELLARLEKDGDPHGAFAAIRAGVLGRLGRPEDALAVLEPARTAHSDDARYLLLEARLLERCGRHADALARLDDVIARAPGMPSARVALPLVRALAAGADETAVAAAHAELTALRDEVGERIDLAKAIARLDLAAGRAKEARTTLARAVERAPGDAEAWLLLAEASDTPATAAAAANAYSEARRLRGNDAVLRVREIEAWLAAGDALRAEIHCSEGLDATPRDPVLLRLRALANRRLGRAREEATDLAELRRLGRVDSGSLLALVRAQVASGRTSEALALIEEALPTAEPEVATLLVVTRARVREGDAAALRVAAERGPSIVLADLQLAHGRADDARSTLSEVLRRRPDDTRAALLLVSLLLDGRAAEDPQRRAACRAVAAGLGPVAGATLQAFVDGRLALAEGRLTPARELLARAASEMPDEALAHLAHGEAAFRAGDTDTALTALRRAVTLPGTTRAPSIVARRLVAAAADPALAERAELLLREALQVDPAATVASLRLTALLAARGSYEESAEVAERALRLAASEEAHRDLVHRAAAGRLAAGQPSAALGLLGELDSAGRATPDTALLRAYALIRSGDAESAAAVLAEAERAGALPEFVAVGRARVLLLRDADADAVGDVAAAWRAAHPDRPEVPLAIGRLLVEHGHAEAALAMARHEASGTAPFPAVVLAAAALRALDRREEAVAEAAAFAANAPPALAWEARLLHAELRMKLLDEDAAGCVRVARGAAEASGVRPRTRLWARVLTAEALLAAGDAHKADAVADALEAAWPEHRQARGRDADFEARVRFVLGVCALEVGDAQRAVTQLTRSLALRPGDTAATLGLVEALARLDGEAGRAHRLAKEATSAAPSSPDAWDTRAEAARRADDSDDAERSWRKAQSLFSAAGGRRRVARARSDLRFALHLRERGRNDEARAVARRILQYAAETLEAGDAERFLERD